MGVDQRIRSSPISKSVCEIGRYTGNTLDVMAPTADYQ
jgi:hypothetical protein